MSTKKTPDLLGKVKTGVRRWVHLRDERDAALKAAAASLAQLEAMVDSGAVTAADVDAAEAEFEDKVAAFVELDKTLSAACDCVVTESHIAFLTVVETKNLAKA